MAGVVLLAGASAAWATPKVKKATVSLQYGSEDLDEDDLRFAFDSAAGDMIIEGDLGDGDLSGAGVQLLFANNWMLAIEFENRDFDGRSKVDTDPAAPNDCNINPLLGLIDNCWDTGIFAADTSRERLDLLVGRQIDLGASSVTLTPFWGLSYSSLEQEVDVAFLFPGAFENFIDSELNSSSKISSTSSSPSNPSTLSPSWKCWYTFPNRIE